MNDAFTYIEDLGQMEVPDNGILSKTLQNDSRSKIIQFCFSPGQELSAHTAPFPATLYFVSGEARLKLGTEEQEAKAGAFVYMTPNLEHGTQARTKVVLLLTMIK